MKRLVLFALVVLMLFGAVSCASPAPAPPSASELLNLGERYLLDLNYEQAVAQFLAVIEIEPMNARAYIGAAEAYVALGRTDDAIAVLERGYEATGDAGIADMLEGVRGVGEDTVAELETESLPENIAAIIEKIKDSLRAEDIRLAITLASTSEITEFMQHEQYSGFGDGIRIWMNEHGTYVNFIDAAKNEDNMWVDGKYYIMGTFVNNGVDLEYRGRTLAVSDISFGKYTGAYSQKIYDTEWIVVSEFVGSVVNGVFSGVSNNYQHGHSVRYVDGYSEHDTEHLNKWTVSNGAEGPND